MIITDVIEGKKPKHAKASDPVAKKIKPNKGHESPHPLKGKLVGEADEPKDVSARAKLDHSLRAQGHKVVQDKKKELKKGKVKHKGKIEEGPLVVTRDSDLNNMIDTFLASWKSKQHTDDEYAELLKALGYKLEKDGQRSVITKEDLDEAKGDIRRALAAVAMIATLWGVNKNLAQDAYDASPQLQKLTAYLEVAKEHNDERMIKQLEKRIGDHKMRLDIGKGDVMGADGNPIDVVYDKESPKESMTEEQFDEAAGEKDACYHKVKSRYKVWPSAYASGALVKCRKVGAKNWGNKSKK